MGAFTLDTGGEVTTQDRPEAYGGVYCWSDLSPFAQGYVEALFASFERWPSTTFGDAKYPALPNVSGHGVTIGLGFSDLSPEALALIIRDCERALRTSLWGNSVRDGRLFWSERTEELFSGFWGGQQTLLCETLFPPLRPFLNEDGKVCLEPSNGK